MARRKVGGTRKAKVGAKRKTTRRRSKRRIGAVGNIGGMIQKFGGLAVGAVASREIITLIAKMFPTMTPTIAAMLQVALGFATPQLVKSSFGNDMGDGAMAAGAQNLLVNLGIISGVGGPNDRMSYRVGPAMGSANFDVVAGVPRRRINGANFDVVAGIPQQAVNRAPRVMPSSQTMAGRYIK